MPYAASGDSSRNAAPGSTSALMRSRGSSLPRARCFCARLLAAAAGDVRGLLAQVGDEAAHHLRVGPEFRRAYVESGLDGRHCPSSLSLAPARASAGAQRAPGAADGNPASIASAAAHGSPSLCRAEKDGRSRTRPVTTGQEVNAVVRETARVAHVRRGVGHRRWHPTRAAAAVARRRRPEGFPAGRTPAAPWWGAATRARTARRRWQRAVG